MEQTDNSSDKNWSLFEERKRDHIELALNKDNQTLGLSGLENIQLIHEALPEINFADIDLNTSLLGHKTRVPMFVSSMTLGHDQAGSINRLLAQTCERRGWAMGVGSQRRQLNDRESRLECEKLREAAPRAILFGNIGLSQLISADVKDIQDLVDSLEAQALFVHTNPLQECLQPEGTPQFKGGLFALRTLCEELKVPVILKETGCGFSLSTVMKIQNLKLAALDVSGLGGTHWGRIEGQRAKGQDVRRQVSADFANWGISTVDSLMTTLRSVPDFEVWASGGVRSGLDVARLLALGARAVGIAQPALVAAMQGEEVLDHTLEAFEYGLKTAMFCMGLEDIRAFTTKKDLWQWHKL